MIVIITPRMDVVVSVAVGDGSRFLSGVAGVLSRCSCVSLRCVSCFHLWVLSVAGTVVCWLWLCATRALVWASRQVECATRAQMRECSLWSFHRLSHISAPLERKGPLEHSWQEVATRAAGTLTVMRYSNANRALVGKATTRVAPTFQGLGGVS